MIYKTHHNLAYTYGMCEMQQRQLLYIFGTLVGIVPPSPSFTPAHDAHWDEHRKIKVLPCYLHKVQCKVRPDNEYIQATVSYIQFINRPFITVLVANYFLCIFETISLFLQPFYKYMDNY